MVATTGGAASSGWPGAEITPLDQIKPYAKNARTHPPEQIALLAKMFKQHGVDQPIVVDEEGVILKGHGRRLAAIEAGLKDFPVVSRIGLSETDKKALRLADNQVALLAGWDRALLQGEIGELKLAGYDMPLLGFDSWELSWEDRSGGEAAGRTLAQRFGGVPFSVFNAREGWWQERKNAWRALGLQPELGRGDSLANNDANFLLKREKQKRNGAS